MNLELKDFQSDAVDGLILRLLQAKAGVALGLKQAVVLSSPTGSGKTVIMAALIEEMIDGSERFQAESPVFLWLSDQPELNEQSRRKLLSSSSRLTETDLIVIEPTFDQELLGEARVYFLNIQKLTSTRSL